MALLPDGYVLQEYCYIRSAASLFFQDGLILAESSTGDVAVFRFGAGYELELVVELNAENYKSKCEQWGGD